MSTTYLVEPSEAPGNEISPDVTSINPQPNPKKTVKRLRDLRKSGRDQFMIDPRIIVVDDGHNPRNYDTPENRAHIEELKESIRENGTLACSWTASAGSAPSSN